MQEFIDHELWLAQRGGKFLDSPSLSISENLIEVCKSYRRSSELGR